MDTCYVYASRSAATHHWPPYTGGHVELIVPRRSYEASLGMRRDSDVTKQLNLDLPRSDVRDSEGRRLLEATQVHDATPYGRFCTQAVCAPILEWFMHAGLFAREVQTGHHPMRVRILPCGGLLVSKRLHVGLGIVDLGAYVTREAVVLSTAPIDSSVRTRRRRALVCARRASSPSLGNLFTPKVDDPAGETTTRGRVRSEWRRAATYEPRER